MSPSSNIRVFVDFKEDTVFAGEDVQCTITFKCVEPPKSSWPRQIRSQSQNGLPRTRTTAPDSRPRSAQSTTFPSRQSSLTTPTAQRPTLHSRSETDTSALNVVDSYEDRAEGASVTGQGVHIADAGPHRGHGRSVSIISLGRETGGGRPRRPSISIPPRPGHARAASLQTTPTFRKPNPRVSSLGQPRSAGLKSPLSTNQPMFQEPRAIRSNGSPNRFEGGGASPSNLSPAAQARRSAAGSPQLFKFPSGGSDPSPRTLSNESVEGGNESKPTELPLRRTSPRATDESTPVAPAPHRPALARVFSAQSVDNTPRTSGDFYSMSNHSNETLTSENPAQPSNLPLRKGTHSRSPSSWRSASPRETAETLMMGYAQIQGSFTLDGSLVNQGPFDDVKRRGVVGGQGGGGVVGLATPHEENSLFGSFGGLSWGTIGESLGGLLRAGEPSSIKEMKGIADSKNIPLISTAKSILFVDLRLEPGQSKSFSYTFGMPRGLPPSHRGRAMKVSYNLVVGTQRPGFTRGQQQIKQVEIPFRLFGGVNERGELLGHDLMSPYIILNDQARTRALDSESSTHTPPGAQTPQKQSSSSASDFQSYVNHLLAHPRKGSDMGLLSPTEDVPETPMSPSIGVPRMAPSPLPPPTMRSLIDMAIMASSRQTTSSQSSTHFTIARASVPIATLTLSRPALKLGDLLTCVIDFSNASLQCYALEATLESVERVDPSLAIRSQQSIERATRRVWARSIENCVWTKRCVFQCQIPVTATPAFDTTGVSLEWSVRLEIVVAKSGDDGDEDEDADDADADDGDDGKKTGATAGGSDGSDGGASEDDDDRAPVRSRGRSARAARRQREQGRGAGGARRRQPTLATAPVEPLGRAEQLLDEVSADERGRVFQAAQWLPCESFEVAIPIRVFGAAVASVGGDGGFLAAGGGAGVADGGTGVEGLPV